MLVRDAAALRQRIAEAGLTHEQLAEAAGISSGFVSHLVGSDLEPRTPRQRPCPFAWPTAQGPAYCIGPAGHLGRHARTNRPRRRSCAVDTAHRIANALRTRTGLLFEQRGADDPSTGPLPVVPEQRSATPPRGGSTPARGGRHRATRKVTIGER